MTFLSLVTWVAIVVLLFGSTAVFIWFLFGVRKILQAEASPAPDDPPAVEDS